MHNLVLTYKETHFIFSFYFSLLVILVKKLVQNRPYVPGDKENTYFYTLFRISCDCTHLCLVFQSSIWSHVFPWWLFFSL